MATRRYDIELALAKAVKAYLESKVAKNVGEVMEKCPVVTFFDPMAQQEAERCVVLVRRAQTMPESPGNYPSEVEVTLKSRVTEKNVEADIEAHFARVNEVRDKILSSTLKADLDAQCVGFAVDFTGKTIDFETDYQVGWIYSDTSFVVKVRAEE